MNGHDRIGEFWLVEIEIASQQRQKLKLRIRSWNASVKTLALAMMITFMFSEPERKQGSEKGFGVQMARRYSENKWGKHNFRETVV